MLDGYVDVYLPDLKYFDSELSEKYSGAADYFEYASAALKEMYRQVGDCQTEDGLIKRGMIVRHMTLPSHRHDSVKVIEWLADNFPKEGIRLSLMSQYTPFYKSSQYKEISRGLSTFEYNFVLDRASGLGFEGYAQERSSAKEEYTPDFDLAGI